MLKPICLFFLMFYGVFCCKAQIPIDMDHFIDSLETRLRTERSDSISARIHFLLTDAWMFRDTAKAHANLNKGRELSRKYPYLEGISYAMEGAFYYAVDLDRSELAYHKADALLSKFDDKQTYFVRANIWGNCASILQRRDDDRGFVDIMLNKALPLAKLSGRKALVGSQYVNVGLAFMELEQYKEASLYFDKAIENLESEGEPVRLVSAYNRAIENYIKLKDLGKAKDLLDKAREILAPYPQSDQYAGFYLSEGLFYNEMGAYARALESFDKGIMSAKGPNKFSKILELKNARIEALIGTGRYEAAKRQLDELTRDDELMSWGEDRLEVYEHYAAVYAGMGNMKEAYTWLHKAYILNDSLYDTKFKNDINMMEMRYDRVENQKKIAELNNKNQKAVMAAKTNRLLSWLLGSVCVFLLIVALLALLYYRNNKKLAVQQELNHRQQLKEIEQQQQLTITTAMLKGEEQERNRIARDLHDGLGGMLAGVKINLSGLAQHTTDGDIDPGLNKVIGQLDNSVSELRRIARNMMPETLMKFGLETALKDLCESVMSDQVHIDFQCFGIQPDISLEKQITIYRIIQEVLSNAVRHAQASRIVLQCSQNESVFFITAEDNGKGFDTATLAQKQGMGFNNIQNRVDYLKGSLEIISAPGEGTTINIELNVAG
ncbi:tetratricopeptide repeat-containing sensor histidine kinase [Taibaiella chishuiensis]|uniref:Signal transduction histidine kinase n=1 Tax=Taibaiella chishuiensis TaxID=1434707 RepID=A0A2P8D845_9BACT|nr:sensor histidine kinase [Taibaiella chishuiensis]PSK93396.1 signal transduction histidine kinase [Taibaiella chishuiensis]